MFSDWFLLFCFGFFSTVSYQLLRRPLMRLWMRRQSEECQIKMVRTQIFAYLEDSGFNVVEGMYFLNTLSRQLLAIGVQEGLIITNEQVSHLGAWKKEHAQA